MPRSSGTFTAPSSSVNPAVEGTTIDETDFNALINDVESALTESVYTGGLGSTDNQLVRTDGTDTKKVQGTGITVDDSNNVSGIAALTVTTINVGNADTTIARTGAGDISVEGNAIYRAGGTDVPIADGGTGASTAAAGARALLEGLGSTQGDILYRNGTQWTALGTGTVGQVLQAGGAGANPSWATVAGTGDVTAASSFGTDNRLIRSDGTGKGVQASGITVDDSDNVTGAANLVTASSFGTDNRLIRSDGTGKGVQSSGITIDDSDNVTGATNLVTLTGSQTLTNKTLTAPAINSPTTTTPNYFAGADAINVGLAANAATSALTISLKGADGNDPSASNPVYIPFRSSTAATGTPVWRTVSSSLSVTIPASQALGTSNSVPFRVWIVALDNSGTVELAVINCLVGGSSPTAVYPINEASVVSTTAIASAPSAAIFYSTTARTSKAIRILGYVEYSSGLATAGTWASAPTTIQIFGPGVKRPGDIVQTSAATLSTTFTSSSTTFTDITGLSTSITPTSAANVCSVSCAVIGMGSTGINSAFVRSVRGSTAIGVGTTAGSRTSASGYLYSGANNLSLSSAAWTVIDAPGATSSTTYKVQGMCNAAGNFYINRTESDADNSVSLRGASLITVSEIMA